MQYFSLGSIRKNLMFLVILAVLPSLAILLYTGMEQRRNSIEAAQKDVILLTRTMAHVQEDITNSFRQMLVTLSLLPEIQSMNLKASSEIFSAVLHNNPQYHNILLIDVNGMVLAAGKTFSTTNLADRKHVREALISKDFAAGEFILTRLGPQAPVFPFAYPVLDKKGQPIAVLSIAVDLTRFTRFYEVSFLPVNSFISITDHQGTRLLYYPLKEDTNPVGKSIKAESWEIAKNSKEPGIFSKKDPMI